MKPMRGFRGLQSRLTLSYALVTTVASALALALLFSVFAILLFNTDELPLAFARATALQANDVRESILNADSEAATRWLSDLEREDDWSIIDQSGLQYGVNLGAQGDAVLTVLASDGRVIGSTHAVNAPGPAPIEAELIARVRNGEYSAEKLFASDGTVMAAAAPMLDEHTELIGIVVARTWRSPTSPLAVWGIAAISSVLPALCLILPGALVIGLVFGYFTARGLTRRVRAVAEASAAWSAGDFSRTLPDRSADELGDLARRLNAMAAQLQTLVDTRQALAVSEERNRLALELHDSVKQQAFAASANLAAARAWLARDAGEADHRLAEAEQLLDGLRQELAALILDLRPPALDGRSLPDALHAFAADWSRQTGLAVDVQVVGDTRVGPAVELALLRIVQESLANSLRHSGATHVGVTLTLADPVTLIIVDDGRGFKPAEASQGIGLQSMRERVTALGGTLDIDSAPQSGTRLSAQIPAQA